MVAAAALTLMLTTACGAESDEVVRTRERPPQETSRPLSFAQVSRLRFGTPRATVVRQIGPPLRRQKVKPYGVVASCFRYRALDDASGQIDPRFEFRLCYDRRDRLSLKSTAPPG